MQGKRLEKNIEKIKQDHFIDSNTKQQRLGVGWGDKEALNKNILPLVKNYSKKVNLIIINCLKLLYSELYVVSPNNIYSYFKLFDKLTNSQLTLNFKVLSKRLEDDYQKSNNLKNGDNINIISTVDSDIDSWKNRFGKDVNWEKIINFKEKISKKTQERVNLILEDRILLARNILQEGIKFYNIFLEKQTRYQEETLEEQLAEKAWINQQRQALEKIQMKLEYIIN